MSKHSFANCLLPNRCSSGDLQKPAELDGKACAAVGQPDLMALFKTLFSKVTTYNHRSPPKFVVFLSSV